MPIEDWSISLVGVLSVKVSRPWRSSPVCGASLQATERFKVRVEKLHRKPLPKNCFAALKYAIIPAVSSL